uniref:phospholipase A2 n=1 Tax=Trichuris muris TaxID=70415 RepID=A0A5S6R1A0_TRIMR
MEKPVEPLRPAQYMQPISNFIGNVVNVAREKVMGETWWLPSSPRVVVEIPLKALSMLREVERKDRFSIRRPDDGTALEETVHITMDWKNGKHVLSLYRCNNLEEAYDHFNNLIYFLPLFDYIECRKRLDSLLHCIRRHALWMPVHVAAMLGIGNYFESLVGDESKISNLLNQICQPEGRYPLHIAVENCHIDLALYMINVLKVPISQTDLKGQNVFHYAARTSPNAVTALAECEHSDEQINILSKDGYTPLFMSITSCKPTCTTALIKKGAVWDVMCNGRSAVHQAMLQDGSKVKDIIKTLVEASPEMINQAEPQTGNSALHIAGNKQALLSLFLVCTNLNLEMRNKAGQTALHVHVHSGNLGCTLVLLYNGANPDAQDTNGNTGLHLAVSARNVDIVKALLVLGANPNIVNNSGDSPRHLAARLGANGKELLCCLVIGGAERCKINHKGCVAGCIYRTSVQNEVASEFIVRNYTDVLNDYKQQQSIRRVVEESKSGKKLKFLLSLDGGGIRGLILVQMLLFIESLLQKPLVSCVDWLAGTSTGAFVAAGICKGKTLRECQMVYLRMKDMLFEDRKRPYDSDAMERQIKEHIGLDTRMTEITKPKLIVTSVLAQKHPVKLHIFRSYTLPGEDRVPCHDPDSPEEMPLWKVLRCTSAAPTYFTSVDNKFVDGGLIANNPSVDLLSEIQLYKMALEFTKSKEELEIGCLLSIGTGRIPDMPIESLNVGIAHPIGMVNVLKNLGYMVMDQVTATEGRPVDRAKAWCNEMNVPFFRFNPQMSKDYLLDTKNDRDLERTVSDFLYGVIDCSGAYSPGVELVAAFSSFENLRRSWTGACDDINIDVNENAHLFIALFEQRRR